MGFLTRDEILATELRVRDVEIEGRGTVRIRELDGPGRIEWGAALGEWEAAGLSMAERAARSQALLMVLGVINEAGEREFSSVDDVEELLKIRPKIVQRVGNAVYDLSELGEKAIEEGKGDSAETADASS